MTVATTTNREQYATDGVTTTFTIHFPFFDDGDVHAIATDAAGNATVLALSTDFSVTGGNGAGGTLTTTTALAVGGVLTIFRNIPFTQEDDYVENDPLPADTLESGFDRAAMRDQQLQDAIDRALTFPVTVDPGVSGEMPSPAADRLLGWNAAGTALENKTLPVGSAVYSSTANTNLGLSTAEAVTPKGLHDSIFNPNGKHLVPILASAMQPAATNPAAFGATETTTNRVLYRTLDFDATTQEFAGFVLPWPKSADETIGITFKARWTAASGAGGVTWALYASARSDGEDIDVGYGAATQVTDTKINNGYVHVTPESAAMTIQNGLTEGDLVFFRVARVPADAGDTLAGDARLLGIDLFITTNAGTDA